jgi:16S rRNA U516 pseudouridylate synthase RsuA-like enzyme
LVEDLNTEVMRLVRVSIGTLELGNLEKGKWRYLTAAEAAKVAAVVREKMR